ncbi:outer membrane beta-barrel protein [Oxalobacteraceae bacterium]|nr:outer membrane beta-barrel protein [Oxalobacteraceae bacterium]
MLSSHSSLPHPGRTPSTSSSRLAPARAGLALLIGALFGAPANAALSDTIHPYVGVGYSYDDNLLRQADEATGPRSDSSRQLFAGVEFERPIGRQRVTASGKLTKVSFNRFDELNYDGKDLAATWFWQLGDHLSGSAGATYNQNLASFSDFRGTERNLRTQRSEFVDGAWRFHPSWQLRGRQTRDEFRFDLAQQHYLNRNEDASEAGIDYLAPSGSTIGLQYRRLKGSYPNPLIFEGQVADQGFTQDELKLKVFWKVSGITQLQFLGGRVKRQHTQAQYSTRDASGTNGRAIGIWMPSQLIRVTGQAWREFTPYEGTNATYSLNKGLSVAAQYALTSKITLDGQIKQVKRDFATVAAGPGGAVQDSSRNLSLGAQYVVRNNIQLGLSVFQDQRDKSSFSTSYRAKGASLNANIQF